jgi:hypothetical protein
MKREVERKINKNLLLFHETELRKRKINMRNLNSIDVVEMKKFLSEAASGGFVRKVS